jgi:autotransporter-associated beta strand protein
MNTNIETFSPSPANRLSMRPRFSIGAHKLILVVLFTPCLLWDVRAEYNPPAAGEVVVDGGFTSPQEYANALKIRDDWNVGWFYTQYTTNWHSTNTITFFKMHAFDDPAYGQPDGTNGVNTFEFKWSNTVVKTWVFIPTRYPTNNVAWLTAIGLTNYTTLDADGGFIVRLNDDPDTDARWKPGDPQPGDIPWNFTNYYGVFAYGGFNNSGFTNGYNDIPDPREDYEWSITLNQPPGGGGSGAIIGAPQGPNNPPAPPICAPVWVQRVKYKVVDDWKPEFAAQGGIPLDGFGGKWLKPVGHEWVCMGVFPWAHPFLPVLWTPWRTPWTNNWDTITPNWQFSGANTTYSPSLTNYVTFADATSRTYETEMTQLDISGGTLPSGVQIRESPTQASSGQTTIKSVPGGYAISSFFDIFIELSTDGGSTWYSATNGAAHMELTSTNGGSLFSTNTLPPLDGQYISPEDWHGLFENGIMISNAIHHGFTDSFAPPGQGQGQVHSFSSQADMMVSTNGGETFESYSAPGSVTAGITNTTGVVNLTMNPAPAFVLVNNNEVDYTFTGSGRISGDASLFKQGSAALIINNAGINDFSGGCRMSGGTLAIGRNDSLGTGPLCLSDGILRSANMAGRTISNHIVFSGNIMLGASGSGSLTFNGSCADLWRGPNTLLVTSGVSATIYNAITNTGALIKDGPGTLRLAGTNTYTGPTAVSGGTLALIGSGSISNSSVIVVLSTLDASGRADMTFRVASGQSLLGDGSILGSNVVVGPGAMVWPGALSSGIGTLSIGNHLVVSNAVLNYDLGTNSDRIAVGNSLTLKGSTLNVSDAGGFGATNSYTVLTCNGSLFGNGLTVGTYPYSNFISGVTIDTTVPHKVNLNIGNVQPPVANFFAVNTPPSLAVTFTDTSAGPITNRVWDFGDLDSTNLTAATTDLVHAYPSNGIYTVTLIVSGGTGSGTNSQLVSAGADPYTAWAQQYFPCYPTCTQQWAGAADPDGDGMNNMAEFLAGTDPTSSASAFQITSLDRQGNNLVIAWKTAGPRTNAVQAAPGTGNGSFATNNFQDVGAWIILNNSGDTTTNFTEAGGATNTPSRYYRIRLVQ